MTLATQSVGTEAQDVNWQSIFNLAFDRSLDFEPGDALKHGSLVVALKNSGKASNNATAGTMIEQAIQADDLQKTADGYNIVRDGPSTGEIRQSLKTEIRTVMRDGKNRVIQSPTSSGKTYTPSTTRWRSHSEITADHPVVFLSGTTDARDDALAKSEESHATAKVLHGRNDACPLAGGEYDSDNDEGNAAIRAPDGTEPSDWFTTLCEERGLHTSIVHSRFERRFNGTLPCCKNGECPSTAQWENIPRNGDGEVDYDILHATHQFARVPQLIENCNVIIDECPDFEPNIGSDRLNNMVTSYLSEISAPVRTWEGLMARLTGDFDDDLDPLRNALSEPDTEWFTTNPDAHALAPGIVEAIATAEKRSHDRWVGTADYTYPTLTPNHEGPDQKGTIRIVIDSENNIQLLQAIPDFSKARSIIGLDAFPTMPKWEANTILGIETNSIVEPARQHKWRRNQRNLTIIQVGDNKNSWTLQGYHHSKVAVLCSALLRKYGKGFKTGITSKRFVDDLEKQLTEVGVDGAETIYYGNEKSINDFDSELAGIIAGCIGPGSDRIKNWIALLDKNADQKCEVEEGHQGGQDWVGEDTDLAEEILADVREKKVQQACGRYARSPQEPDDGATVYVLTNVLPDEFVDERVDDVRPFGAKQKRIIDYVASHGGVTVRTILDSTDITRKHIDETLRKCVDYSWMQVEENGGAYNADVFYSDCSPNGFVEV